MKKLLVIDANSIINRCFYGVMQPLTAPDGLPTNALFAMVNVISAQLGKLAPDYAVAAYDVHHPTFRHEMYSQYKAGRHDPLAASQCRIRNCHIRQHGSKLSGTDCGEHRQCGAG